MSSGVAPKYAVILYSCNLFYQLDQILGLTVDMFGALNWYERKLDIVRFRNDRSVNMKR